MTGLVRTELLRLRTTRTAWTLTAVFVLLTAARMLLVAGYDGTVDGPERGSAEVRDLFVGSAGLAALLLPMLLGALAASGEFHHHTATWTFLVVPDRRRLVWAKVLGYGLAGVVLGAGFMGLGIVGAVVAGAGEHVDAALLGPIAGMLAISGWAGAFGACLGTVVRHSTAAALAPVLWFVVVEPLLTGFRHELGRLLPFTPGAATTALSGADAAGLLPVWAAALVLIAYAAALGVPGMRRLVRADIT